MCDFAAADDHVLEVSVAYAENVRENAGAYGGRDEGVADVLDALFAVGVVDVRAETGAEGVQGEGGQHDDPPAPAHAEDVVAHAAHAAEGVQHARHAHGVAVFAHVFAFDENVHVALVGVEGDDVWFGGAGELCGGADAGAEHVGVVGHGDGVLGSDGALCVVAQDHFVDVKDQAFGLS